MPRTTMRISEACRDTVRELAAREGTSMQEILEKAIEQYRRQRFLKEVNKAYGKLRQDPEAMKDLAEERAAWDSTSSDGLAVDEEWTEHGEAVRSKADA